MRVFRIFYTITGIAFIVALTVGNFGCGQIGMPTGGPKDSIPPRLINASPQLKSTNVTGTKIVLNFDEYIELKEPQTNVLISPYPKKNPSVEYRLRTVTVKLKDTLLPNTTYSINFGKSIVDLNEGNPFNEFTYVFSTGSQIDSLKLTGKVIIAETGKADSTIIAMLYRNANDSSVEQQKPDYIARLIGDGSFEFVNLAAGNYSVYALKDQDGNKTYSSKKEIFAFADKEVTVSENTDPVILYASAKEKETTGTETKKSGFEKKLIYTIAPNAQLQDILMPFEISFNNPLKTFNPGKLVLTDTNYNTIPAATWSIDSNRTKLSLDIKWQQGFSYKLFIDSTAFVDSADNSLVKNDTISFVTKSQAEYGNVILRFSNLDLGKHPVLQFVQGEAVVQSYSLSGLQWQNKMMNPGEYELRILFDSNQNGKWDPGDYSKKIQPEKVISLPQKLGIRANWDNERDIKL